MFNYIDWHYLEVWPKILLLWRNITLFPVYYFSIPTHLKTLFSPWKKQVIQMKPGFHVDDLIGVFFFNVTSRILGAIVKSILIIFGLLLTVLFFLLGSSLALIWIALIGVSFPFYLLRCKSYYEVIEESINNSNGSIQRMVLSFYNCKQGKFVITRLGLNPQIVKQKIGETNQDLILNNKELASLIIKGSHHNYNFYNYYKRMYEYPPLLKHLDQVNISPEDFTETCLWYEKLINWQETLLLFDLTKIKNLPGIGYDWSYGYTVEFDKYARDLTEQPSPFPWLLGRNKELQDLERILLKTQDNNCLIIGEPGVGKHILIETLARNMRMGKCDRHFSHKRILSIDMHQLISAKESIPEVKGLFSEILKEAERAGNIIIYIDELDRFVTTLKGRVDLSDSLIKFAGSRVGMIATTTPQEFRRYLQENSELINIFETIELLPPDNRTLLTELQLTILPVFEKKYRVIITHQALIKLIEDAGKFITAAPFPGKAIELLDEVIIFSINKKQYIITDDSVDQYLSQKLHLHLGKTDRQEKERLLHLEDFLHQRVINQNEAIKLIAAALRRARLSISSQNKPIGSFLFLGPTGVGKTETAKALSYYYFGSEEEMLRFDMGQYQGEEGLARLIGSVNSELAGELTGSLKKNPNTLLLLDEFEKADEKILNLFLTILDEGYITSAFGKKINCKNTIIIATSNAGTEYIREFLISGQPVSVLRQILIDHLLKEKIFSPELVNRFDSAVIFTPLNEGQLREVAKLMLNNLNQRLSFQKVSVDINPDLIKYLVNCQDVQQFGGRAIRREIETKIEDTVARKILSGKLKKGEKIVVL